MRLVSRLFRLAPLTQTPPLSFWEAVDLHYCEGLLPCSHETAMLMLACHYAGATGDVEWYAALVLFIYQCENKLILLFVCV